MHGLTSICGSGKYRKLADIFRISRCLVHPVISYFRSPEQYFPRISKALTEAGYFNQTNEMKIP